MAKIYFSSQMPRGTSDDCERGREPARSSERARAGVRKAATEKGEKKKEKKRRWRKKTKFTCNK